MINLDSILKGRDITLPTQVHLVKAMVFSVVMYGCDSYKLFKIMVPFYLVYVYIHFAVYLLL